MKDESDLNQDGNSGGGKEWLYLEYILMIELIGFIDEIDVSMRKSGVKDEFQIFE